tara:strand:+ start:432 stop:617 length:186 start_codon:yes stop_codon:yes gene_type:complete
MKKSKKLKSIEPDKDGIRWTESSEMDAGWRDELFAIIETPQDVEIGFSVDGTVVWREIPEK